MSNAARLDKIEATVEKGDRSRALVAMLALGAMYGTAVGISIEQNRRTARDREERERDRLQHLEYDLARAKLVEEVLLARAGITPDELEADLLGKRQAEFERQWGHRA